MTRLTAALADRYRIERELGAGGMATVYLAAGPQARPQGRDQGAPARARRRASAPSGSCARSRPPRTCSTRTSCRCIDSGEADGIGSTTSCRSSRARSLRDRLDAREAAPDRRRGAHRPRGRRRARLRPPARRRSTATSSRRTSCSTTASALVADFGIALAVQPGRRRPDDRDRHVARHAALHEPRAGDGRARDRRPHRRLRARLRAVRDARRRAAVHRPDRAGDHGQGDDARSPRRSSARAGAVPRSSRTPSSTALEKLPADRFASAAEFAAALADGRTVETADGSVHGLRDSSDFARPSDRPASCPAALLLAVALAVLGLVPRRAPGGDQVATGGAVAPFAGTVPPPRPRAPCDTRRRSAPDGSSIVFGPTTIGTRSSCSQAAGRKEATVMAGTEGGVSPFFSPDGEWIGYLTVDRRSAESPGGRAGGSITLADLLQFRRPRAAAWLDDGTIVFVGQKLDLRQVSRESPARASRYGGGASRDRTWILATLAAPARAAGPSCHHLPGNCGIDS